MFNYTVLSRNPSVFRSFTGLKVPEFDAIYTKINEKYAEYQQKRLQRPDRKRGIGADHPFKLPLRDRLLMLLMYHQLYVTSALLGYLFNLGQSNVLKNIRILEPLVKEALPLPSKLHRRARRLGILEELEELFPGLKSFLDATEQTIPRPRDKGHEEDPLQRQEETAHGQDPDNRELRRLDTSQDAPRPGKQARLLLVQVAPPAPTGYGVSGAGSGLRWSTERLPWA